MKHVDQTHQFCFAETASVMGPHSLLIRFAKMATAYIAAALHQGSCIIHSIDAFIMGAVMHVIASQGP